MAQKESKTHAPKVEFYANNRVARILRKLGLRSRAQIAAWVTQRRSNILRLPLEERYGGEAFFAVASHSTVPMPLRTEDYATVSGLPFGAGVTLR